jgi:hypothetical protein
VASLSCLFGSTRRVLDRVAVSVSIEIPLPLCERGLCSVDVIRTLDDDERCLFDGELFGTVNGVRVPRVAVRW